MRKCNLLWAALDAFGARYMYPFRAPNDRDAAEHKAGTLEPPLVHEVSQRLSAHGVAARPERSWQPIPRDTADLEALLQQPRAERRPVGGPGTPGPGEPGPG